MAPRAQFIAKLVRLGLISTGAMTIMSGIVGIIATIQLIEPSEEQSLGISRNEFVGSYAVLIAIGLLLIWLGLRRRK